jgi:hypothetical protein
MEQTKVHLQYVGKTATETSRLVASITGTGTGMQWDTLQAVQFTLRYIPIVVIHKILGTLLKYLILCRGEEFAIYN